MVRRIHSKSAIVLCLLVLIGSVGAATQPPRYERRTVPVTIFDGGGVPIGQYIDAVTEAGADPGNQPPAADAVPKTMPLSPVVTTKAAPGRLPAPTRGQLQGGPGVPICILGDDPLSQEWLQINQAALLKMKAVCLVVAVRDQASWEKLRAQAGDLPMTPGSFDALSTAMGVSVYPILVAPDGLVSQ